MMDNLLRLSETQLNREEIKEWVEADFDELTEEFSTDEAIIQRVINPISPKYVDTDNNDVAKSNNISWNQAAKALNTFTKFFERSRSFNHAESIKLHILRNDFQPLQRLSRDKLG